MPNFITAQTLPGSCQTTGLPLGPSALQFITDALYSAVECSAEPCADAANSYLKDPVHQSLDLITSWLHSNGLRVLTCINM
jgi:hypothetical protein